jgi:deoxycytidine triphosphate deaminase
MDAAQIGSLVASPSLGAVTYQAQSLLRQLSRINDQEYLPEACTIRDLFACITEHIRDALWAMRSPDHMFGTLGESDLARVRTLGRALHELHSYLRYLWASAPQQSPPGIQAALKLLTELHFPIHLGKPACLVRPQWKYNLTYVSMTVNLKHNVLIRSALDPNGTLGSDPEEILGELWKRKAQKITDDEKRRKFGPEPPKHIAILSFAGLDAHDTLLFPLLAHELGHFIDLSHSPPLSVSAPVANAAQIREQEVRQVIQPFLPNASAKEITAWHKSLVDRVFVALREIIADLLATRMMGFGFFAAHSEFLKTLAEWPQTTITGAGYPGIRYRLHLVLQHLLAADGCDFRTFLMSHNREPTAAPMASDIDRYLSFWEQRVALPSDDRTGSGSGFSDALDQLVVQAVKRANDELVKVAKQAVPEARCFKASSHFFERIRLLADHLPPSFPGESAASFAEITSAAWAYQIIFGEERENSKTVLDDQRDEYARICQLTLKAIELIPTGGGHEVTPQANSDTNSGSLSKSGILSGPGIKTRLGLPVGNKQRLSVLPFQKDAVQAASLDVRLGNWFVIARRTRLGAVKMDEAGKLLLKTVGREEVFVSAGQTFVIHPGDLLLGVTLEFVALPPDLMAFVEGKSSLGRLGLLVATATTVAPGFHGVVVLELANTGTVPLELIPEMPIAQLVFQVMTDPVPEEMLYQGQFDCQIKP